MRYFYLLILLLSLGACNNQNIVDSDGNRPEVTAAQSEQTREIIRSEIEDNAETAYREENWETAEINYLKLLNENPDNSEHWYRLGNIYTYSKKSEAAIHAYRQAIISDKNNIKAWNNLGMTQLRHATETFLNLQDKLDVKDPMYDRINVIVEKIQYLMSVELNSQ